MVSTVIKLVIAVACIILLIYVSVSLTGIWKNKTKSQQAMVNIENLEKSINDLGEGKTEKFTLLSPRGWALTGWPVENLMPEECKENKWKNCICLCDYGETSYERVLIAIEGKNTFPNTKEFFLKQCDILGYCIEAKAEELEVNPKKIIFTDLSFIKKTPILIDELVKEGEYLVLKKEKTDKGDKIIIEPEKE